MYDTLLLFVIVCCYTSSLSLYVVVMVESIKKSNLLVSKNM